MRHPVGWRTAATLRCDLVRDARHQQVHGLALERVAGPEGGGKELFLALITVDADALMVDIASYRLQRAPYVDWRSLRRVPLAPRGIIASPFTPRGSK